MVQIPIWQYQWLNTVAFDNNFPSLSPAALADSFTSFCTCEKVALLLFSQKGYYAPKLQYPFIHIAMAAKLYMSDLFHGLT